MKLRDLDLNLLLVFHQLLIDQQVSIAAEQLGLTQPAVSNALRRLRTAMGDELFVRTGRGMQPTPYAARLAGPVAEAITTLSMALEHDDGFDPATSDRKFTIAMTDIGEIYFMPRLIDALKDRAPSISIATLRSHAGLSDALGNGEVDLAVGLLPNLQAGFFQRRLFLHRYICLCRKGHPIASQPIDSDRFSAYGHVRILASSTGHGEVDNYLNRAGLNRTIRLEVPHFVAVGHILQKSDLIATVPERFASSCLEPFDLVALPLPFVLPEIPINIFWHTRFNKDPANQWLRQLMVELFAD
ncbi:MULTISPECIES: LysR family transcriptional regulator [unclassified Pseudomonas]|uniref:LysR family transcriptional regulator n=1 Tax=unclassified Pseudomonas TaxID=196821 RepID=UPI002360F81A|nr:MULTISPECIES: LysR family transcriptional regulator [unclassified Pseudomonas]